MNQRDFIELKKELEKERQLENLKQQMQSPYYLSQQNRGYQLQTRIETIERTNDNTYINVVIDHPEPTYNVGRGAPQGPIVYLSNDLPIAADYGVTKTEPILSNCSEYYCSVTRFTIPLDQVPLLICPIVPNQITLLGSSNPNLTPLIIGIQNGPDGVPASFFSGNVIYAPQNNFPPPIQNQPLQVITPYYYMFAYQELLSMINFQLGLLYISSGLAALFPGYIAPYFIFNPVTNLISIVVPSFFVFLTAPLLDIPRIYMNNELTTFLDSFNLSFNVSSNNGSPNIFGNDSYFVFTQTASEEFQFFPSGVTVPATTIPPAFPARSLYYKFPQQYPTLEYWSSLRKIIITSNTIPVKNEYVPATNNLQNAINVDQSGVNVSYPILTDFVPNISAAAGESRSIAYYVPTSQYRLVDLISTNPLQKIDIRIFWEDRDGNLYPLEISIFQQASLKLGFFKKSLYNSGSSLLK